MRGRWPTAASMLGGLALQGSHMRKVMVPRLSRNSRRSSSKDMASSLISAQVPANFSSCHLKKYFPHGRHTTRSIRLLSTLILCDPSLLVSCPIPPETLPATRALATPPLSIFFLRAQHRVAKEKNFIPNGETTTTLPWLFSWTTHPELSEPVGETLRDLAGYHILRRQLSRWIRKPC